MKPLVWRPLVFASRFSLPLSELKIISEQETRDLLTDVAAAHNKAALNARAPESNQAVVEIVKRILAGRDGVPL
jgi:hypothetical protein